MRGAGTPASAGPACVPADLRANPRSIVAIPMPKGIARTPPCTNTPPTPRHVLHGLLATGDARPPTRTAGSLLIAPRMVQRVRQEWCSDCGKDGWEMQPKIVEHGQTYTRRM